MDELFWVIPDRLVGRPGPDEKPWHLPSLQQAGIGAILSVNDGRLCDRLQMATLGIAYACYPLSDWVPPQQGDIEFCLSVLPKAYVFAKSQMAENRPVIVHCSGGNDRTGLFLSYFLVHHYGLSPDRAIQHIRSIRPMALRAAGWEIFAKQVLLRTE